ncbi:cupredoxin domain-containing protein [Paenibacillus ginsengihumi]|uniref:cupredoxin domain-containing protein n=1 Tax=Paenibacillus ginsengihumi TaxID=431596 RepID=UPI00036E0D16|nr:cupredoxin domain-containing protein [Paenibacillus ginsengihumi]
MAKLVVIGRKHMRWAKLIGGIALLACAAMLLWRVDEVRPAMSSSDSGKERTIHLVTGEFKSTGPDGQEIEAYRWDPGTIYVKKGERIKLSIFGVNGASHPFVIDGLNVKGEVKKGQETVVSFKADKPGIYRIICLTHPDIAHHGPMIGYIVVDK